MFQQDNVGQKIKEYFKAQGISQRQAATMLGVTQQVVGSLLNGKSFGKRMAAKWHEVFGFNPAWLVTGAGDMFETEDSQKESTAKKNVADGADAVASEVLRLITTGELYPASVVKAKDELIAEKDKEIQRLNRELGALRNELGLRDKSTLQSAHAGAGAEVLAELKQ
ncbi:helix-turn-helix domain-containing protein [Muribaculum intestinale]|uniref:helix-turn-helix domain-containing protein n=1 Tax=Muribaculum intestinale TaxID=1796646 RepID=UPI002494462D|nr:helix-turn-helix transcriptional regulator [Muribaculum intestinale]